MAGRVTIVGLGPGDLDRLPLHLRGILMDPSARVIVRTSQHPAAEELAALRDVASCDDLYEAAGTFDEVYAGVADRVVRAATSGDVIYAVPGSPFVAERSVSLVRRAAMAAGLDVATVPAPSFLDEMWSALEFDPATRGVQILDGRDLPDPLPLHLPTVVFHVDLPLVLAEVVDRLGRVLPDETPVTVVRDLGSKHAEVATMPLYDVHPDLAGLRTSLFIDPPAVGYVGVVQAMRLLREECPWDRQQTHHSLVPFALEEVSELVEALSGLPPDAPDSPPDDFGLYTDVEEELGDVLLQVVFHANLAAEAGAFDIEDVAEQLRRKLVRRHPHVFGDVEVSGADDVVRNWREIKEGEKTPPSSLMDGVPEAMSSLARAAKLQERAARVGFDWLEPATTLDKVGEEVEEVRAAWGTPDALEEIGDLLFAVVNVARRAGVEADVALRRATQKFADRFRHMEARGDLHGLDLAELDARWDDAKASERAGAKPPVAESDVIDSRQQEGS